jgi:hypothetical protein
MAVAAGVIQKGAVLALVAFQGETAQGRGAAV